MQEEEFSRLIDYCEDTHTLDIARRRNSRLLTNFKNSLISNKFEQYSFTKLVGYLIITDKLINCFQIGKRVEMKPESLMSCSENETQAAETRPLQHALRKSNVRFKCSNCQRRFPSVLRLRRHLNLVHKGAGKLLWCSKCSLALSEVSDFIQHSRVHHQERKSGESQFFKVSQRQLPSIASQTLDFDSTEGKYKTVPVTREQNASALENRKCHLIYLLPSEFDHAHFFGPRPF